MNEGKEVNEIAWRRQRRVKVVETGQIWGEQG